MATLVFCLICHLSLWLPVKSAALGSVLGHGGYIFYRVTDVFYTTFVLKETGPVDTACSHFPTLAPYCRLRT